MLEMKDVSFNYGNGVPVLEHINVEIGEGEFIGLGGRNGCGKTTVTRLLMGLEKPVSGEILYDGKVINDDDASVRSHFIGYVFQRRKGRCSGRQSAKKCLRAAAAGHEPR